MNRRIIKSGMLVVVALLLALPVIACAPPEGAVPPPEEKVIRIGNVSDLTGPYSTIGVPIFYGHYDYFKYLSEEEGGVNGIEVEELWADHKGDPAFAITLYRRFKAQGVVAMITTTSTETTALLAMLEADKIPATGTATSMGLIVPARWYYNSYCGAMAVLSATFI